MHRFLWAPKKRMLRTALFMGSLLSSHIFTLAAASAAPHSLEEALQAPAWLQVQGEFRARYETLDEQFRTNRQGSDQVLALRTTLQAEVNADPLMIVAELMDARQYLTDDGSPLDTTTVNAFDILQAYIDVNLGTLGTGQHHLRLGRETIDLGSRRLMARNAYRNTINAFTGLDWQWEQENGTALRALWVLPVQRQPDDRLSLEDNQVVSDDQNFDLQLWAVYATLPLPLERTRLELYTFGIYEAGPDTRHRQLYTPGIRLIRPSSVGHWDFEWESAFQTGTSNVTLQGPQLQHRASFHHLSLGYTFEAPTSPNLRLAYDYASGDRDPSDGQNNRFEPLYGARRFEYGPTGNYGAIIRNNLSSPELRLNLKPSKRTDFTVAWRGIWLASTKDYWITAGVRDPSGESGRYVGQQLEARLRWDLLPDHLRVEAGLAQLFPGSYADRATGQSADATYGYFEMTWRF